jgi:hypothetical protein
MTTEWMNCAELKGSNLGPIRVLFQKCLQKLRKENTCPCFRIVDVLAGIRNGHLTKYEFRAINK